MSKTVIIGMNNPLSSDPRHALYPHPPGCSGWRLWQLLRSRDPSVTRAQYLRGFERVNLVDSRHWSARRAAERAVELRRGLAGRTVIVLGHAARRAFGLRSVILTPQIVDGVTYRYVPHPSGRCRWYNTPRHRRLVALLLDELFHRED